MLSPGNGPSPARPAPSPFVLGLLLCLLTLAAYQPVLDNAFVNYDDNLYVTSNRQVQKGLTGEGLIWAWQASVASNWHPLTVLSHMLDVELYGLNPRGHHLTSLLLHLANVWLLFEVLRRMTGAVGCSALVAGLFGVHPTHVESVAWVAERKDVLSGLFFLLTLAAWQGWGRHRTRRRYLLVVLAFACGLLAKPMLVTLPFVLLLVDVWPLGRLPFSDLSPRSLWRGLWPLLVEKAPLFVLSAAASAVTVYTQQGPIASLAAVPLGSRVANALVAYAVYLGKTFWPRDLAVFYPLRLSYPLWQPVAAGFLLAAVTAWALARVRRAPWLAVGWLWFLGMLVPVIGLVQVGRQAMADRYTYLPSIGLTCAVVWGIGGIAELLRDRRASTVFAAAALLVLGVLTVATRHQVATWKDSLTLFRHALAVTEDNYLAHLNVAIDLSSRGLREESERHFREALRLQPNLVEAQAGYGTALRRWGRPREALRHLRQAVSQRPQSPRFHVSLATVLEDLGRKEEAMVHLRKALELAPEFADAHQGLAVLLQEKGRTDEALQHYLATLRADPARVAVYSPAAALLAQRGDLDQAARLLAEALRRKPGSPVTCYNLAVTFERMGRLSDARQTYAHCLELDPGLQAARQRLEVLGR